jgi:putative endonuclease
MHAPIRVVISTEGPPTGGPEWRNPASQTQCDTNSSVPYNEDMSGAKSYYVYIVANQSRTLYVGLTNDIKKRVYQHKAGLIEGFTKHYNIGTLVYIDSFTDVNSAIAREKQIKRWRREKKLWLIAQDNPDWRDLSDGWYD